MRNHNEKLKDMAESVLPSKARAVARRDRTRAHRRERSQVRVALRQAAFAEDLDDLDPRVDVFGAKPDIIDMVWERRLADKVGTLERWAARRVVAEPALHEDDWHGRMAHFRRLLPDNLIGRHALSHIGWVIGTPPEWEHRRRYRPVPRPVDDLPAAVALILQNGAEGELNRRIRQGIPSRVRGTLVTNGVLTIVETALPRRYLLNDADAEAFARDVAERTEGAIAVCLARDIACSARREPNRST